MIRIWDVSQRRLISQLTGHTGSVAALDANQTWLVSGSFDTTVRLWPLPELDQAIAALERQRTRTVSRTPSETISVEDRSRNRVCLKGIGVEDREVARHAAEKPTPVET